MTVDLHWCTEDHSAGTLLSAGGTSCGTPKCANVRNTGVMSPSIPTCVRQNKRGKWSICSIEKFKTPASFKDLKGDSFLSSNLIDGLGETHLKPCNDVLLNYGGYSWQKRKPKHLIVIISHYIQPQYNKNHFDASASDHNLEKSMC